MLENSIKPPKESYQPHKALFAYYAAFTIVCVIISLKAYAYASSGSATMLASLVDSTGDFVVSFISFLSVKMSMKPADEEHRYGHGKVEGFSALFQACFLFGAAAFLVLEALQRVLAPVEITQHMLGISVSIVTILLTVVLIFIQNQILRSAPSLALQADQKHYTSDVVLNVSVIISLALDYWLAMPIIDVFVAILICCFIARSGIQISQDSINMLMDKEIDEADRLKIIDVVTKRSDVFGIHDLRTRKSGMQVHISFDVELDANLTLKQAHDITREIDLDLLAIFPNAEIIIHKDPEGDIDDPRHKVQGVHY